MNRTSRTPELLITLTRGARPSMQVQVQQALRRAIREGQLRPGASVPSSRTLARDLGVSRGVIVEAYEQLIAEGYLVAAPRSATRVTESVRASATEPADAPPERFEFDFRPGLPDLASFPRDAWRRSFRKALDVLTSRQLGYGDPRGALDLRLLLADYLARARGVVISPRQMIISTGCAQGLSIAARVLRNHGVKRIALEDPGHPEIRRIIAEAGVATVPVRVDDDGLEVHSLERKRVQAVIVSPAHQNPMGSVLAPLRRQRLLAWAARSGAFIIEDDYDAEYRYDRPAVGALQGLAPERVIYVGSASKILAPALRLGWVAVGGPLLERAVEVKRVLDNGSPALEQLAFAQFIQSGELDRHIRRMRELYRARRDALLHALRRAGPGWTVHGAAAGLHLVARPPEHVDVPRLVERAAASSVRLYPLDVYASHTVARRGLVIGYASLTESQIAEGIRRLSLACS